MTVQRTPRVINNYTASCPECMLLYMAAARIRANIQCDFRFDLFFSFSFASYFLSNQKNIKPADEDVLMTFLNTIHC